METSFGAAGSVTIRDVARETGVSVATVSRVLNGKGPVREETRQKVEAAVERLSYVPHGAARSLITNKTSTIGVLLPDIYGEFFSEVIRGLDLTARRHGYHVLVSGSHADQGEVEAVIRAMRGRVDGLVAMSPGLPGDRLRQVLPPGLPVVLLNAPLGSPADTVNVDNRGGAGEMVEYLARLGHRRIALVDGPEGNDDARDRRLGYRDALRTSGLGWSAELEIRGDFGEEAGYLAGRALATGRVQATAVFAANDSMAIGCLSALLEQGLRVPEDISVAGFDDIPIARYVTPALTTVRVAIAELGTRAMELLLDGIDQEGPRPRRHETLGTELVVRTSCAPPSDQGPSTGDRRPGAQGHRG